jgi:hypothetical protein
VQRGKEEGVVSDSGPKPKSKPAKKIKQANKKTTGGVPVIEGGATRK